MQHIFNPPGSTELTVLSYGAGQDSTAMLLLFIHDPDFRSRYLKGQLLVIFSDTLNEHPHTYEYLYYILEVCQQHKIAFAWIKPSQGYHPKSWSKGLEGHYQQYQVIMSKAMRNKSCTDGLKIQPIYNYLSEFVNRHYLYGLSQPKKKIALKDYALRYGKVRVLIGITYEEAARRIKKLREPKWMQLSIEKCYALADLEHTRSDCQAIIRAFGYKVPYPSNCIMCPFLSKRELLWLSRNMPEQLERWYVHESAKIEKFREQQAQRGKSNHTVWGGSRSLQDILKEAEKEFGHLSSEELNRYKFTHGHCVLSSY